MRRRKNPDEELRALERLLEASPDDEDLNFRYRTLLFRTGVVPSIECLWCQGHGGHPIYSTDPNSSLYKCYRCQGYGRRTRQQNLDQTNDNLRAIQQIEAYFGPNARYESDYRLSMIGLNHISEQLTQEREFLDTAGL